MELTKHEKKLLEAIIETWQMEGCPNVHSWAWGRDERNPDDDIKGEDDEAGDKLIKKAVKGLEQKLKIKIYL